MDYPDNTQNVHDARFDATHLYDEDMRRAYREYATRPNPFIQKKKQRQTTQEQLKAIDSRAEYYAGLRAKYSIYKEE